MKKSMLSLLVLSLTTMILISCGDDDDSSSSSITVPTVSTQAELTDAQMTIVVDLMGECCQLTTAQKDKLKGFYSQFASLENGEDIVAEGWAEFDAEKANECLREGVKVLSCTNTKPKVAACNQTITPKQNVGDACGKESAEGFTTLHDEVCLSGACSRAVCVEPKKLGEACDFINDVCESGAECDISDMCVALDDTEPAGEEGDGSDGEIFDAAGCAQIKAQLGE